MDVLNIVFSVLNLLATVIVGVIQVTWAGHHCEDMERGGGKRRSGSCLSTAHPD